MTQRIVRALILVAVAAALLALGGVVMAAAIVFIICFAVHEEFRALGKAGHRPVSWPTWAGIVLSVPLLALGGAKLLLPVALGVLLVMFGWPALPIVWLALCVLSLVLAMTGAGGCLVRKGEHRIVAEKKQS